MGYKNAKCVLPQQVLQAVQEFIDGEYLYIPRKEECRKQWGETTSSRERLLARNREIAAGRRSGVTVPELAERHYLSVKAVYKILAAMNRN